MTSDQPLSNHPKSVKKWVGICLKIGVFSFGSSGRMVLYRDAVVHENKWLTAHEFHEILTIGSVLPGPNLINLAAYIGFKLFGNRGAVLGIIALSAPGALLSLLILWFVPIRNPDIQLIFQGFSIGAFSLFAVFITQLMLGLKHHQQKEWKLNRKLVFRTVSAAIVFSMMFFGIPFLPTLISGAALCLFVEFLT